MIAIVKLIHSKYGYETPEWTAADAKLEKWLKQKKKDDPKMDRPFIMPKKERETIKIDWNKKTST
ncbi:hypothetical protein [Pediococcus acidilactici]|uniref:Uncharacterized protein n=1 Tax=Pediococcus acidilactici DSM 20284 TaxID=862514 RepID=E0NDA9_PEDAC|nr:hypothetical protein [Pediococcus acidilactici]AZP90609.1 hypothetical protein CYD95_04335 [Pediococcus acidilactici]EFL96230.1 hypothetical protein HMPREF0623_0281 [Pediococcus acidilactici DSM 20284]KRN17143.1 hypothetical protein IV78_GL000228 [Pediococcus acidilactici]MDG9739581.1 hypothetical protein [Pediococcus acidilactici]NKZ16063.1 hypothetical protein [Pediococcus acidilactici]